MGDYSIDFSPYVTQAPPQVSGRGMLFDAIGAIAKAKALREQQAREDDFNRWKEQQDSAGRAAALSEAVRSHLADESTRAAAQGETGRHNLATEGGAADALAQKKQEAIAKFLSDKDFVEALKSDDPASLDAYTPALKAHGLTVDDFGASAAPAQPAAPPADTTPKQGPLSNVGVSLDAPAPQQPTGEQVDATGQLLRDYEPPAEGSRRISGPGGFSATFDPAQNALNRARAAAKASAGMEESAASTSDPYVASATKDVAPLIRQLVAQGVDLPTAMKLAAARVQSAAGQASTRRNTDVSAASRAQSYAGPGERETKLNESQLKDIDAKHHNMVKELGLDKLVPAYDELNKAQEELRKAGNNPQTQVGVVDRLVRANTGGKATIGQIRVQLEHMGALDAQMQGWLEGKIGSGGLGAKRIATLNQAIATAKDATLGEIKGKHEEYVGSAFAPGEYSAKGNWEKKHQELFSHIVDEGGKPVFPTQFDPNAPTIVRGAGKGAKGINAQSAASTAEAGLSPKDKQLAATARDRLKANPNDAMAKKWLEAHGLQ